MKKLIGLTGQSGAGKSEVAKVFEQKGACVIDCDKIAREQSNNQELLQKLCDAFSTDILNNDKTLNRKALAKIAFSTKQNTEKLNNIMLPYLKRVILSIAKNCQSDVVVLDAPTLIESGLNLECDVNICVLADKQTRLDRIVLRDNISKEDALIRINAQHSDKYYISMCDYTLYNDRQLQGLIDKTLELINQLDFM